MGIHHCDCGAGPHCVARASPARHAVAVTGMELCYAIHVLRFIVRAMPIGNKQTLILIQIYLPTYLAGGVSTLIMVSTLDRNLSRAPLCERSSNLLSRIPNACKNYFLAFARFSLRKEWKELLVVPLVLLPPLIRRPPLHRPRLPAASQRRRPRSQILQKLYI